MFDSGGTLKHLAFFEELAGLEESDPSWRAVTAGLVTLRMVDTWVEEGPRVVAADSWGVRSVRSAVDEMPEGDPVRTILGSILDALRDGRVADFHALAPRLIAYAQSLEYEAKWNLAADLYRTILAHTHPVDDSDVAIATQLRLGQCYRNLNDVGAAAEAFASAGQVANAVGDIVGVLRARIGEARVAIIRGNLPAADQMLQLTVSEARGPALADVRSRALHDRAEVAHLRGQFELSIRLAYESLEISTTPSERDRILADIAASFMELGVLGAARDAYVILSATAQEQYIRWLATVNLLDIASLEGREPVFEQYRRELAGAPLPPIGQVQYQYSLGRGYHRFGKLQEARKHLELAQAWALEHGFNQLAFEIAASLQDLSLEIITKAPPPISFEIEEIADAMHRMREEVSAGY